MHFSSPFDDACVVVLDAIGEFECATTWYVKDGKFEKRWSQKYPNSLDFWSEPMTQRLDLKPQEDEYISMGMAGWGEKNKELKQEIHESFFNVNSEPSNTI